MQKAGEMRTLGHVSPFALALAISVFSHQYQSKYLGRGEEKRAFEL